MEQFRAPSVYIPYGTDMRTLPPGATTQRLGLVPGQYLLYVSRLEPENNARLVIEAYALAGGLPALGMPLVIVGDAPYATAYRLELERAAERVSRVILAGAIFGDGYVELQSNCRLYVQATEVGGTHPALVEAMGRGVAIIANDVPEHREVLDNAGAYYSRNSMRDLAELFRKLAADAEACARFARLAKVRARDYYSWEHVTDEYESLFRALVRRPSEVQG